MKLAKWLAEGMAGYFSTTQRGAGLVAFEAIINPVEQVQTEWHAYVRSLKAALSGKDIEFFKAILVAKRKFRTGRANLLVGHDA